MAASVKTLLLRVLRLTRQVAQLRDQVDLLFRIHGYYHKPLILNEEGLALLHEKILEALGRDKYTLSDYEYWSEKLFQLRVGHIKALYQRHELDPEAVYELSQRLALEFSKDLGADLHPTYEQLLIVLEQARRHAREITIQALIELPSHKTRRLLPDLDQIIEESIRLSERL